MQKLESILELLQEVPALSHRILAVLLLLVAASITSGMFKRKNKTSLSTCTNGSASRPLSRPNYHLTIVGVLVSSYVLWTLIGFSSGSYVLARYDSKTFRDRLFGDTFTFESYDHARKILGEQRYLSMLRKGYTPGDMSRHFRGAPADYRRIEVARRQLRGNLYDRTGKELIENRIDPHTGRVNRFYDPHPALQRLLGKFEVSPEKKQGLEWVYREVLAPEITDRNRLLHFGRDLNLSIHAGAQKRAYDALNLDGIQRKGTVIVLNPHTGEVYVLVSSPSEPPPRLADPPVEGLLARIQSIKNGVLAGESGFDYQSLEGDLKKIENRFSESTYRRVSSLMDRLEFCSTRAVNGSGTRVDPSAGNASNCVSALAHLHRHVSGVHLNEMSLSFHAHQRMHFRQSAYSLGSAFKPFIAAVAEDAGLGSTFTGSLHLARTMGVPSRIYSFEAKTLPAEDRLRSFTIEEGLYRSLNTVFAPLAWQLQQSLGRDSLVARLESIGFNRPITWNSAYDGLNKYFPIRTSELFKERLDPDSPEYYRANIYSLGIGAENMLRATPLHLALMTSYLANGRYVPAPTLETDRPVLALSRPGLGTEALQHIRSYLRKGVTHRRGTSHRLYQPPLESLFIAAKTGTSTRNLTPFEVHRYGLLDRPDIKELTGYHAWSVAIAGPSENDLRVVAVVSIHDAMRSGYRPGLEESEWASRTAVRVMYEVLSCLEREGFFL